MRPTLRTTDFPFLTAGTVLLTILLVNWVRAVGGGLWLPRSPKRQT